MNNIVYKREQNLKINGVGTISEKQPSTETGDASMSESCQIGFIIEKALGHITHGKNLQSNLSKDSSISSHWHFPSWDATGIAGMIPNWTVKTGLQTRKFIAETHRQTPLDVLFFHTQVTAVLAQDWVKKIPSIISLDATPLQYDSLGEFYTHDQGPEWLEKIKWRLNSSSLHAAKRLVTWSAWAKQGLIDEYGIPDKKITVIPPGVNLDGWVYPNRYKENKETVRVLFVGGNLKRKGGDILLEAFRALRQQNLTSNKAGDDQPLNIELHLVTKDKPPSEPGLFIYNDMQPNSDDLKELYAKCDIFCLPTLGDCLPMVLSEAGATGLPLISTDVAAIPEIVRDGETGFLIPTNNVIALMDALKRLTIDQNLRLDMGQKAYEVVHREFDAKQNALHLLHLLKQTVYESQEKE